MKANQAENQCTDESGGSESQRTGVLGLQRNVVATGLVSLFTDFSSEMIHSILPLFLANVLGAGAMAIGVIEGIAEATASLLKIVSGVISDKTGNRKILMVLGYGVANLIKPFMALTSSWQQVLGIRFADRFAKGVRGAPRDAMIADSCTPDQRGLAYGFHRALDTTGAVLGPLVAFLILSSSGNDYRLVFWLAAVPGVIATVILILFVRERGKAKARGAKLQLGWRGLGLPFALFTGVSTLFAVGNSSDAFLVLRSQDLGMAAALVPLAYMVFNVVYALLSTPLGVLSDRVGRKRVLVLGYLIFAGVYLCFALANGAWAVWALFAVYGVYYAMTEGVQKALIADLVPSSLRASAMGTFNACVGVAVLPASMVAGLLWESVGPSAPFAYGAATGVLSALLLLVVPMKASR